MSEFKYLAKSNVFYLANYNLRIEIQLNLSKVLKNNDCPNRNKEPNLLRSSKIRDLNKVVLS